MRKHITISILVAFATMMFTASCSKQAPDKPVSPEPFNVELEKTSVTFSPSGEATVPYTVTGGRENIRTELPEINGIKLWNEYDVQSGTGTIYLSAEKNLPATSANILFYRGTDTVEKKITILTSCGLSLQPYNIFYL